MTFTTSTTNTTCTSTTSTATTETTTTTIQQRTLIAKFLQRLLLYQEQKQLKPQFQRLKKRPTTAQLLP
jgi:hypothetical protein